MVLKLYNLIPSPPCIIVRMGLKRLNVKHELVNIDFDTKEQESPEFLKKNPNGEVPCIDDNGFLLSESVAILQYIAEKYKKDDSFYPSDLKQRAIVHHRLAFHNTTLYRGILDHWILPVFVGSPKTEFNLKKLQRAVTAFEKILADSGTSYAAGNTVTIADLALIMSTVCLEAIEYDLSACTNINAWYKRFQKEQPEMWELANEGLTLFKEVVKNPPPTPVH